MNPLVWIEAGVLAEVEKALSELLYEPDRFKGFTFPFGGYTIEQLECEFGRYDIVLAKYFGRSKQFVASPVPEPALAELIKSGEASIAVQPTTASRRSRLHQMIVSVRTGNLIQVRRGSYTSLLLRSREMLSVIVTDKPPRYTLDALPAMRFQILLDQFRSLYWGPEPDI